MIYCRRKLWPTESVNAWIQTQQGRAKANAGLHQFSSRRSSYESAIAAALQPQPATPYGGLAGLRLASPSLLYEQASQLQINNADSGASQMNEGCVRPSKQRNCVVRFHTAASRVLFSLISVSVTDRRIPRGDNCRYHFARTRCLYLFESVKSSG